MRRFKVSHCSKKFIFRTFWFLYETYEFSFLVEMSVKFLLILWRKHFIFFWFFLCFLTQDRKSYKRVGRCTYLDFNHSPFLFNLRKFTWRIGKLCVNNPWMVHGSCFDRDTYSTPGSRVLSYVHLCKWNFFIQISSSYNVSGYVMIKYQQWGRRGLILRTSCDKPHYHNGFWCMTYGIKNFGGPKIFTKGVRRTHIDIKCGRFNFSF